MRTHKSIVLNLNLDLHPRQIAVKKDFLFSEIANKGLFYGSGRSGKSLLAALAVVTDCLLYPKTFNLIAREYRSDLKLGMLSQTIPYIFSEFSRINGVDDIRDLRINGVPFARFNENEGIMYFYNGSCIFFRGLVDHSSSPKSKDKVLGTEYHYILLEEATALTFSAYGTAVSRLAQNVFNAKGERVPNKIMLTINPGDKSCFTYKTFVEKLNFVTKAELKNPEYYASYHFHTKDNPSLSKDFTEGLLDASPSDVLRYADGVFSDGYFGEIFHQINWVTKNEINFIKFEKVVIYIDPSYKSGTQNDFKAVVCVGMLQGSFYLISAMAEQTNSFEMIRMVHETNRTARLLGVRENIEIVFENAGIADDFNSVKESFFNENKTWFDFKFDNRSKGDKFTRIESLLYPLNKTKRLLFYDGIKDTPWLSEVENQFLKFRKNPHKGLHDDVPDAIHGAVSWLLGAKRLHVLKEDDLFHLNKPSSTQDH